MERITVVVVWEPAGRRVSGDVERERFRRDADDRLEASGHGAEHRGREFEHQGVESAKARTARRKSFGHEYRQVATPHDAEKESAQAADLVGQVRTGSAAAKPGADLGDPVPFRLAGGERLHTAA